MSEPERIDVNTFAELVGRSKRQIYKHIKTGRIPAVKPNANTAYQIERSEIERFLMEFGGPSSLDDTANPCEPSEPKRTDSSQQFTSSHSGSLQFTNPPPEAFLNLVDRLTRAERRNVELEFILRQHQNLLTENAESLQEVRADTLQAEAKAEAEKREREAREAELKLLAEELKEARSTIVDWEARRKKPWWKKMFGAG